MESGTEVVAMDCEMVGLGPRGESGLARCSLVDLHGTVLYDKFIRPEGEITDYRTLISGITPWHMQEATPFAVARLESGHNDPVVAKGEHTNVPHEVSEGHQKQKQGTGGCQPGGSLLPQAQKTGQKLWESCPDGGLSPKMPLQLGPDTAPPQSPRPSFSGGSPGEERGACVAVGRRLSPGPPWEGSGDGVQTGGLGTLAVTPRSSAPGLVDARSRPALPKCARDGQSAGSEGWPCH
ncbi:interferon-stimulated gene 20 kDa protein isoform X1 [Neofelis nebulosa]|uniref:interferon-stimulated gene 20 kDa protein isoform X1 n=1 Tax=Neofelis nebulosa TaxID=61452 RepID=UPI00272A9F14|nr:interferon-stimulated gene 20 kDa protein isoform X1 [Neofelis nebulosa]